MGGRELRLLVLLLAYLLASPSFLAVLSAGRPVAVSRPRPDVVEFGTTPGSRYDVTRER